MSTKLTDKPAEEKQHKRTADQEKELNQQQEHHDQQELDKAARKEQRKRQKEEKRKNRKPRRRVFPIWLRIIVVLVLCAIALLLGAIVGYGIVGDGAPSDALELETWKHIIEIVLKKEK